jgi:hypothetical protein
MATARPLLKSPELCVPNDDSIGTPLDPRDRLARNLNRSKIPGLDGIRAVSALTVAAAHANREFLPAGFAVVMFFILSGLLITWLLLREGDRTGSVNLRAFYIRRAFRLLPPLASLIVCTSIFKRPPASTAGLVTAALYCVNYFVAFGGQPLGIGHTDRRAFLPDLAGCIPPLVGKWAALEGAGGSCDRQRARKIGFGLWVQ